MQNNKNSASGVDLIGYDSGWGCADYGCEDGPEYLSTEQIMAALRRHDIDSRWKGLLGLKHLGRHDELTDKQKTLPLVGEGLKRLAAAVLASLSGGRLPLVLGGDHSSGIATWSAVTATTASAGRFGLIWIDAHLDAHTADTAWQGKFGGWWHGQSVAAITGHGLASFTGLCGEGMKIAPQHMSIVGARSFEPAEIEYVRRHKIFVATQDDVEQKGFAAELARALDRAQNGTQGFGLSIDLDAFDPEAAPGVGTAEERGLDPLEVLPALKGIGRHPAFRALEIVEYNPHKDKDGKTARLVTDLVDSLFS